ncbi:MAG: hypothetical protein KDI66_23435, partial [Xanthomonadales bacterium]|nr:hypothetical protein [Xanthomonadales bacterium]
LPKILGAPPPKLPITVDHGAGFCPLKLSEHLALHKICGAKQTRHAAGSATTCGVVSRRAGVG